jgi:hypothetical protein
MKEKKSANGETENNKSNLPEIIDLSNPRSSIILHTRQTIKEHSRKEKKANGTNPHLKCISFVIASSWILLASLVPQLSAFPAAYTIHPHLGHV